MTVLQDNNVIDQDERNSHDTDENEFGKLFLELSAQFDLLIVILNGTCDGDEAGHYTFISTTGCSVIDYFALSRSIAHSVSPEIIVMVSWT